jgi:hypothetical protein
LQQGDILLGVVQRNGNIVTTYNVGIGHAQWVQQAFEWDIVHLHFE